MFCISTYKYFYQQPIKENNYERSKAYTGKNSRMRF